MIQEVVRVRARRCDRGDAAAVGRDYAEPLAPLLGVTGDRLRRGVTLFETTPTPGAFHAVLAAAAVQAGAAALVFADRAFADLVDVHHIMPDPTGVAALLADARQV